MKDTIVSATHRMESSSLKVMKIESRPTKRPETIKVIENGFNENSILIIESKLNCGLEEIFWVSWI